MGEKETQMGMILIVISAFFLFSSIGLFDTYNFFEQRVAILIAYLAVAIGVYQITKK